jgi:hypothetical protein
VSAVDPSVEVSAGASSETRSPGPPDVEITASASAREIKALDRVETRLEVTGGDVEREDTSRRENLPPSLEPGTAYRDVRVHRRVGGRLITREEF